VSIADVISLINQTEADGVVDRYAIGGAVGATFYLQRIIESKRAWRRSLAQRPVAEKLALLDELRDRARAIRAAATRRKVVRLRASPPGYRIKPRKD